jgi:uncharacterized protein DUF6788
MPDPIHALETQRDDILRQMSRLGDMRKGSITEAFRPCGKSACACSAPAHPGHGPYYAFTTKVEGKTKTVQLRAGSRLDKFQREVDTYKRFRALSEKLIEVNQALCEARPEPDSASPRSALKKTSPRSSSRRSAKK